MKPFNFWSIERATFEGYLRTKRADWFSAVEKIAEQLQGTRKVLDIGSGDGHSTRQILARLEQQPTCDLLEPDATALERSSTYLKTCNIGQTFTDTLAEFIEKEKQKYDAVFGIHTNYYWGAKKPGLGRIQSRNRYHKCLDGIMGIASKSLILTSPSESDYYDVVETAPFPEWVSSEYVLAYYKSKGFNAKSIPCNMHFYIGDIYKDRFAARETWKFFNNTEREPSRREIQGFLEKVNAIEVNGEIDFKDVLVVVTMRGENRK